MISFVVLLLICAKFGVSQSPAEVVSAPNPINVKFTKSIDFTVEGGTNSWKDDLRKFLFQENEAFNLGTKKDNENVSNKSSSGLHKYENTLKNIFDKCKYMVGKSQIPFCLLNPAQTFSEADHVYPSSCKEILKSGKNKSDVYIIKPKTSNKPFAVLCDMEIKGGGWTHIQRRFDGSQDFYLPWRDYKFGFGNLMGEFWIGLENIYDMTAFETSELLVELTDTDKKNSYAQYTSFSIGNEKDGYILNKLEGYSGDAGDSLTYHLNQKFSTLDVDQDNNISGNCAQQYEGAWWYKECHYSNLNGKFMTLVLPEAYKYHGLNWQINKGYANLAGSRMMIRPVRE
ncbi:ficolin-2-like [Diabrotica virgifera virgifera]|uniref:Ficolin-2-like n=1 Tax=Diabrotica virgifera virgifera TaxID=50390 RepID=A0A6P7GF65_DIAVI|nr:ficolin-2-like [Diabrotica virgifera virgifera]